MELTKQFTINNNEPVETQFDVSESEQLNAVFTINPASTVSILETTTLPAGTPATVENVGSDTAAVLVFNIPQGEKGDKGEQGIPGERGEPGPAGTSDYNELENLP